MAFDLDGTLLNFNGYYIRKVKDYFPGRHIINPDGYAFWDIFGLTPDEAGIIYSVFGPEYEKEGCAMPYITDAFTALEEMGIDYILLSNRGNRESAEKGRKWFEENVLAQLPSQKHFAGFCFQPEKTLKGPVCIDEHVDIIVEDTPEQIFSCAREIPVIKYEAPYNRNACGENIYPLRSYKDFRAMITTIINSTERGIHVC